MKTFFEFYIRHYFSLGLLFMKSYFQDQVENLKFEGLIYFSIVGDIVTT